MTQTSDSTQSQSNDHDLALSGMQMLSLEPSAASGIDNTSIPVGPCANPPRVYISSRPGDDQDYPNCCRAHQVSFERYVQSIAQGETSAASTVVVHAYDMYTRLLSSGGSLRLGGPDDAPSSSSNPIRPFSAGTFTLPAADVAASGSGQTISTPLPSYAPMPSPAPTYNTIDQDAASIVIAESPTIVAASHVVAAPIAAAVTPVAVAAPLPISVLTPPGAIVAPPSTSAPAAAGGVYHSHSHVPAHLRWYVVTRGTTPGIHRGWHIASPLVIGIRTSSYAGFDTRAEALEVWQESLDANVVTQL